MPGFFRETRNEEANRYYWVDLIQTEEMETRNEEANRCDETRNEEANRCDWVDLIQTEEMETRNEEANRCDKETRNEEANRCDETRNEEANRCDWVDLIQTEEMETRNEEANRCYETRNEEANRCDETRNEEANRCDWVDLIQTEEMETRNEEANRCYETGNEEENRCDLVDLFIRLQMPRFIQFSKWVNPIKREVLWVNPIKREDLETRNEGANRCHWVNPIKREVLETRNEGANRCHWVNPIKREDLETRNEGANRCHWVNPIKREVLWVNPIKREDLEIRKTIANLRFETRNEGANRCHWVDLIEREEMETRNEGANRCHAVDLIEREEMWVDLIEREEMKMADFVMKIRKRVDAFYNYELRKINERMMQRDAIPNADSREEKMTVEKKEVYLSNRRFCHGTKSLKSSLSLAPFFLPCAGGTGHGSDQPEHQGHSEIYPSTLNVVSNCPSPREYMQRAFTKCADVCGSYMQDGNCVYHCMRDSSKTKLVEFCAKPKPLFDFCPEYDPVDQTIQKDLATLCNSTSSRNYYNSSDIYFCDPNNCLQLRESSVQSGATTLTTLINETTEMSGGYNQEWFLLLTVVLVALILAITIGCSLFYTGRTGKMTKKRKQNGKQYAYTEKVITDLM